MGIFLSWFKNSADSNKTKKPSVHTSKKTLFQKEAKWIPPGQAITIAGYTIWAPVQFGGISLKF